MQPYCNLLAAQSYPNSPTMLQWLWNGWYCMVWGNFASWRSLRGKGRSAPCPRESHRHHNGVTSHICACLITGAGPCCPVLVDQVFKNRIYCAPLSQILSPSQSRFAHPNSTDTSSLCLSHAPTHIIFCTGASGMAQSFPLRLLFNAFLQQASCDNL